MIEVKAQSMFMNINIIPNLLSSLMIHIGRWSGRGRRGRWGPLLLLLLLIGIVRMVLKSIDIIGVAIGIGIVEGVMGLTLRWWWWWWWSSDIGCGVRGSC